MTAKWIERLRETEEGRRLIEQERLIMQATEAIAALLQEQDVSRAELARRIGKSPAFVTKLMRGDNNFTLRTLSDVLFALSRSVHLSLGSIGEDISLCATKASKPLVLDASGWGAIRASWTERPRLSGLGEINEVAA
ncbi:MAG: helix-turn-helix domain-containing protein [Phycisphaerales bacterium]